MTASVAICNPRPTMRPVKRPYKNTRKSRRSQSNQKPTFVVWEGSWGEPLVLTLSTNIQVLFTKIEDRNVRLPIQHPVLTSSQVRSANRSRRKDDEDKQTLKYHQSFPKLFSPMIQTIKLLLWLLTHSMFFSHQHKLRNWVTEQPKRKPWEIGRLYHDPLPFQGLSGPIGSLVLEILRCGHQLGRL